MQIFLLTALIVILAIWVTYLRFKISSLNRMVAGVLGEIDAPLAYCQSNTDDARKQLEQLKPLLTQDESFEDIDIALDVSLYGLEQISELVDDLKQSNYLNPDASIDAANTLSSISAEQAPHYA